MDPPPPPYQLWSDCHHYDLSAHSSISPHQSKEYFLEYLEIFSSVFSALKYFSRAPELTNKMSFVNSLVYPDLTATKIFVESKIFLIFFFRIMKMLRVILMIL